MNPVHFLRFVRCWLGLLGAQPGNVTVAGTTEPAAETVAVVAAGALFFTSWCFFTRTGHFKNGRPAWRRGAATEGTASLWV